MKLFINDKLGEVSIKENDVPNAKAILVIAHGSGAGMDHPFMEDLSEAIARHGTVKIIRFNFPYMEQGRKSPGSQKSNIETWKVIVEHAQKKYPKLPLFISGKSYGGRMASHLIAENLVEDIQGIIYFGFPLHAPGKASKERADHLSSIKTPQLFLQGTRDKFADKTLIAEVIEKLSNTKISFVEEAEHSFKVPKKSGKTANDIMKLLSEEVVSWVEDHIR